MLQKRETQMSLSSQKTECISLVIRPDSRDLVHLQKPVTWHYLSFVGIESDNLYCIYFLSYVFILVCVCK